MTNHRYPSFDGRRADAVRMLVASMVLVVACSKGAASPSTTAPPSNPSPAPQDPNAAPPTDPRIQGIPGGIPSPSAIRTTDATDTTLSAEEQARVKAVRDREMAIVTRDPAFKAHLMRGVAGVTDPTIAFERGVVMGRILSARGMARLSDVQLQQWMHIRLQLVLVSEQACSGLWAGSMPDDVFTHALASIEHESLADFMHLSAEATLAELHAKTPLVQDADGLALGVAALTEQLKPEDRVRFDAVLRGTLQTPSDHCFASRVLHERTAWIEPKLQVRFIRALAASMAEP